MQVEHDPDQDAKLIIKNTGEITIEFSDAVESHEVDKIDWPLLFTAGLVDFLSSNDEKAGDLVDEMTRRGRDAIQTGDKSDLLQKISQR